MCHKCVVKDCDFKTENTLEMILHYLLRQTTEDQKEDILKYITEIAKKNTEKVENDLQIMRF